MSIPETPRSLSLVVGDGDKCGLAENTYDEHGLVTSQTGIRFDKTALDNGAPAVKVWICEHDVVRWIGYCRRGDRIEVHDDPRVNVTRYYINTALQYTSTVRLDWSRVESEARQS